MEDDTNHVKIDKEFLEGKFCSIFELYIILKDKNMKLSKTKLVNPQADQIVNKCLKYVERFNKFGSSDNHSAAAAKAFALRQTLEKCDNLKDFERAQLINLAPHKAEEAIILIPSLKDKLSPDDLQYILDEISKNAMNF